jgi:cytoskeletal protein RodZ
MGHMKFAVHSQFFITSRWDHPFAHHGNGVELYTYLLYLAIYLALGVQHRFFFFFFLAQIEEDQLQEDNIQSHQAGARDQPLNPPKRQGSDRGNPRFNK